MPSVQSPAPTASGVPPAPATPQDGTHPVIHDGAGAAPPAQEDYPEQRHAGAVGYGPDYNKGAGTTEKFAGLFEEAKGKILRKPDVVEHGHEKRTGELKQKEKQEAEKSDNPFAKAEEDKASSDSVPTQKQPSVRGGSNTADDAAHDKAATVAPEGTAKADEQRQGPRPVHNIG